MRISSAKDVCPRCGRHSEFATAKRRETWFHRFDAKNTPVTCLFCGATVRRCELRRYTPAERTAVEASKGKEARNEG